MMKSYQVQVKFAKDTWTIIENFPRQSDAMHFIKDRITEDSMYPMRIVRIVKTIVFEGK